MKVIYLNVEEFKMPKLMNIPHDLSTFYELINCDNIEVVTRKIGTRTYTIICDEEGLFKRYPIVSMISDKPTSYLVGNLIITSHTECGEFVGLSDEEIKEVMGNFTKCLYAYGGEEYYVLRGE